MNSHTVTPSTLRSKAGFRGWEGQESWAPGGDGGVPCVDLGEADWAGEMQTEVQLQAELLSILSESFSDCSPECLQLALVKGDWSLARASAAVMVALQVRGVFSAKKTKFKV